MLRIWAHGEAVVLKLEFKALKMCPNVSSSLRQARLKYKSNRLAKLLHNKSSSSRPPDLSQTSFSEKALAGKEMWRGSLEANQAACPCWLHAASLACAARLLQTGQEGKASSPFASGHDGCF